MKKSRFTEKQIAFALRQMKPTTNMAEVCRKMRIGKARFPQKWQMTDSGVIMNSVPMSL